jgi:hypothetical protein
MSEITSFKLLGGDEIVAEVLSVNRKAVKATKTLLNESEAPKAKKPAAKETGEILSYTVRRPHILQFQPMGNGQLGLAFVPWTLSNPTIERLEIPASAVILPFSPSANVEREYIQQTSGLALAPAGSRIST